MLSTVQTQSRRGILSLAAAVVAFSIGAAVVPHAFAKTANDVAPVATAVSPNLIVQGSFEGRSDHVTSGETYIMKTSNGGYALVLSDNFFLDGAPDPVLGFGKDGRYIKASQFAKLEKKSGRQTYSLPDDFNIAQFNEIYVWCEKFSVPLGVAIFN